jgi:spermidine dehydrogenase
MTDRRDRDLGMKRRISRRDFMNGAALGAAGLVTAPGWLQALALSELDPEKAPGYYPPALTGLRGSHEGSYQAAHALRDGSFWETAGAAVDTGETYDLVVVGGGLSGLSAARFYRKAAGKSASVLVLDNHDDFGGHAKRNELRHGERTLLGYGGTFSIESPAPYSAVAKGLLAELKIDVGRVAQGLDRKLYPSLGLRRSVFFDKETFGADVLLPDPAADRLGDGPEGAANPTDLWARFLAEAPLPEAARRDVARLYRDKTDYMPGLSSAEKKARLAKISYADFITTIAKLDRGVVSLLQTRPHSLYGLGIDAVPAQDAWGLGLPGFQGMALDPTPGKGMNYDSIPNKEAEAYFFHFPDGNASIARLLVRGLIPAAIPGTTVDDVITARANYARLDEAGSPVRIRLNSSVVRVKHSGEPATAKDLEITYLRGGKLRTVRAKKCILACWNGVIPYICPELPEKQKDALAFGVKVPIVYTNVLIKNWTSFQKLAVSGVYAPGSFHTGVNLDLPVSLGAYHCSRSPEEPIVLHLMRTPCSPGLPARQQHRAGRVELLGMPFGTFERKIREQLGRTLGAGGFDPARDIEAITVNRWPHGYAYQYNSLFDAFWLEGGELPCVVGRKPFGRLAIANADAQAYAYTDAAIDQAHRAVQEVLALKG